MKITSFVTIFGAFLLSANAHASMIGGVDFPDGARSFADEVVSYNPGPDVGGGAYSNPSNALGAPDGESPSIGNGGELTLAFNDNSLTTSGDSSFDLWIFESGPRTEFFNVGISTDNQNYIDLGDVSGQPTGIDIDAISGVTAGTQYSYVRLTDIAPDQTGFPYGEADFDAVGAIASAPPVIQPVDVPEPSAFGLGLLGLLALAMGRLYRARQWQ